MQNLIVVGEGSHSRGIESIINAINNMELNPKYKIVAYQDDQYDPKPGVGKGFSTPDIRPPGDFQYVVGINNSQARNAMVERIYRRCFPDLIHPTAILGTIGFVGQKRNARVSSDMGIIIQAGVVITGDVDIGEHTHINVGATISQGCNIGRFVTISPGVHIAGEVHIGDRVQIGTGANIINLINICDDVIIGAGATVIEDITEPGTYVGVPARRIEDNGQQQGVLG